MGIADGTYAVFFGDTEAGTVSVRRDGLFTELDCVCRADGGGIKRLCAVCGGERAVIGVLAPREGGLRLRKRYSENELKRLGIASPERFIILPERAEDGGRPSDGGWSGCREPWALFSDAYLREVCRSVKGALMRKKDGMTFLAVPVYSDAPFPMMPAFCFGEPADIGGREYIVFGIENGELAC